MVLGICLTSVRAWPDSKPALLENDESAFPPGDDMIFIPDEDVPLAAGPGVSEIDVADGSNEVGESEDPYDGLNETQIQYVNEVLKLVNEARAEAGVHAVELDPILRRAAQVRAKECVGAFSHTRPNGSSYKTAIEDAGINAGYTGENEATGNASAKHVMQGWMDSPGHRENILNENFTKIGIGLEKNVGNPYGGYAWAQLFIK